MCVRSDHQKLSETSGSSSPVYLPRGCDNTSVCWQVLKSISRHSAFSCLHIGRDSVDHSYPCNSPQVAFDMLLKRTRSGCATSAGSALFPSRYFRSANVRQTIHLFWVVFNITARVHFLISKDTGTGQHEVVAFHKQTYTLQPSEHGIHSGQHIVRFRCLQDDVILSRCANRFLQLTSQRGLEVSAHSDLPAGDAYGRNLSLRRGVSKYSTCLFP